MDQSNETSSTDITMRDLQLARDKWADRAQGYDMVLEVVEATLRRTDVGTIEQRAALVADTIKGLRDADGADSGRDREWIGQPAYWLGRLDEQLEELAGKE